MCGAAAADVFLMVKRCPCSFCCCFCSAYTLLRKPSGPIGSATLNSNTGNELLDYRVVGAFSLSVPGLASLRL